MPTINVTGTIGVPNLPLAGSITGTEQVVISQGGVTKTATTDQISELGGAGVSSVVGQIGTVTAADLSAGGVSLDANNLSDLTSQSSARANILPVTKRGPSTADTTNFTVGNLWVEESGQVSQLLGYMPNGDAIWDIYPATGPCFGDLNPTLQILLSTTQEKSTWTAGSPLFTITRASDLTSVTITLLADLNPDVSSTFAFLQNEFNGIGYVTEWFDQSGNGYNATQTLLGSAMSIWLEDIEGNNIPVRFDGIFRNYITGQGSSFSSNGAWAATGSSGNTTITLTSPGYTMNYILPGWLIAGGANIPYVAMNAEINGTTLTVGGITSGALIEGLTLLGTYTEAQTILGTQIDANDWNVTPSQTAQSGVIYGYPQVVSVDYAAGTIVSSLAPTGSPGPLTFYQPGVFMDLPNGLSLPWRSWSVIVARQFSVAGYAFYPFTLGATGEAAYNPGGSFVMFGVPSSGVATGARLLAGDNLSTGAGIASPGPTNQNPTVDMVAMGGTNGRSCTFQISNTQGEITTLLGIVPDTNLLGGAIGYSRQVNGPNYRGQYFNDSRIYSFAAYSSMLQLTDASNAEAAISTKRKWRPQVQSAILCDGSSTTAGLGTDGPGGWPYQMQRRLRDTYPCQIYNIGLGGSIEYSNYKFPSEGGVIPVAQRGIIVLHAGDGDSLQQGGTIAINAIAGNVVTLATNPVLSNFVPGCLVQVSGNISSIPVGTTIVSITTALTYTATLSNAPTGDPTGLVLQPDTAANFWTNLTAYCITALSFGYYGILFMASASRSSFLTNPVAFAEFNTMMTFYREDAKNLPGFIGLMLLEDFFQGGSDGATMVVTGISGSQVTVNALSGTSIIGSISTIASVPTLTVANVVGGVQIVVGMSVVVGGVDTNLNISAPQVASGGIGTYTLSGTGSEPVGTAITLTFAVAGSRVRWEGMPFSVSDDTGGQTITAVSGTTLTVSGSTAGLAIGSIIQAINPTPWLSWPEFWNFDGQHFQPIFYRYQGLVAADMLLQTGRLQ